jgi:death-on-curing protein
MRDYLTTAEILSMHHALLEKYGGAVGIRDLGAVEAAAFRPQCGYYSDIIEETAALAESLLFNHPFVDGNKRTAFAACDVFLRINGCRLRCSSSWLYERMMLWIAGDGNHLKLIKADLMACIISDSL